MIGSVQGQIIHRAESWVIVEAASGLGLRLFLPDPPALGENIRLFVHHHVREDASDLYGFASVEDLALFELLLSVSGVGPKLAQTIVSRLGRPTTLEAIGRNQPAIFRAVSGVGQKVAEKIIVELRNKVDNLGQSPLATEEQDELITALSQLGYHQSEILNVLKELEPTATTSQKLKQALRLLHRP